jgi:hypothetical protein
LSQIKAGDQVYTPPGIKVYQTAEDAVIRKNGVDRPYDHGLVISVKTVDGEIVARFEREGYELPVWSIAKDLKKWTPEIVNEALAYKKGEFEKMVKTIEKKKKIKEESEELKKIIEPLPSSEKINLMVKWGNNEITLDQARQAVKKYLDPSGKLEKSLSIQNKYKEFAKSEIEKNVLEIAANRGYDLMNMTPKERSTFDAASRRAIDSIKSRFSKSQ